MQTLDEARPFDLLIIHLDHRWFFDVAPNRESIERADELVRHLEAWLSATSGTLILNTISFVPHSPIESDRHQQVEFLATINSRFFDFSRRSNRVSIIDAAGVLARIGHDAALRERNRLIIQFPYAPAATAALVEAYAATITASVRARRKVVVVDADDTLWGGVLGEDGPDAVVVDQEYPGVLYYNFQSQLAYLRGLGILLCIVTKNNESEFLEVFRTRTMPLKLEDFVAYRSNWLEKSENIANIADELNLGLDSFIFIDDNPFEIEEVRARLGGVECHLFPKDSPEDVLGFLWSIKSLQARGLTAEDLDKTEQYRSESERKALERSSTSLDDYLASLSIEIRVSLNNTAHVARIAQLTNKTNQFNLTTRRYTESEIEAFMASGQVYDFRVIDRFGDMGIVGLAIMTGDVIDTFLMSCRALGRKIESQILRYLCYEHRGASLKASFRATAKNGMVEGFYESNGFDLVSAADGVKTYILKEGPDDFGHVRFVRS